MPSQPSPGQPPLGQPSLGQPSLGQPSLGQPPSGPAAVYGQPPQDPAAARAQVSPPMGSLPPPVPVQPPAPVQPVPPGLPQQPVSAQPGLSQQPVSAQPGLSQAASPQSAPPYLPAVQPFSAPPDRDEDDPLDMGSSWQPRISPSPPKRRRRGGAFVIGLLLGAVLFGAGGFGAGYLLMPEKSSDDTSTKSPGPSQTKESELSPFEASQLELNRAKFSGDLAALAEPWLSQVGGCLANSDPRGPKLAADEQARVFCEYGGINVYFVQYKSVADRDAARTTKQRQNIDAQLLTPGVAQPSQQKKGASGKNAGDYIEFSYKPTNSAEGSIVSGIWWDRENTTAAAYLEVMWNEGLGGKWEPLRDLWQRRS